MCRSIKTLRTEFDVTEADIEAAALQFVRKISGYRQPAKRNADVFHQAVHDITAVSQRMLAELS